MANIVWSDVVAVAPELATGVAAAFQTLILGYVNEVVQASEFGGEESYTYTLARAYLAAHYGKLHKESADGGAAGTSGPVTGMTEGGVSISFATSFGGSNFFSDPSLGLTKYGLTFLGFVRRSPANAGFVT